ncbi:WD repeat-containing protein 82 [Gryllus bimaculatus]|nr:WD repeat-containing protein 82 [Gryllus bimaculatus]
MNDNENSECAFLQSQGNNYSDDDDDDVMNIVSVGVQNRREVSAKIKNDESTLFNSDHVLEVIDREERNRQTFDSQMILENVPHQCDANEEIKPYPKPRRKEKIIREVSEVTPQKTIKKTISSSYANENKIEEIISLQYSATSNTDTFDAHLNDGKGNNEELKYKMRTDSQSKQEKRPLPRPRSKANTLNIHTDTRIEDTNNQKLLPIDTMVINECKEIRTEKDQDVQESSKEKGRKHKLRSHHNENDKNKLKVGKEQRVINQENHEDILQTENTSEPETRKIIGIIIHRSDSLQVDMLIQHPVVKVHLLDASTGKYLKKSSPDRAVSFYYEDKSIDFILPLMTKSFDFKIKRSLVPTWEELLLFNEDIQLILKDVPPVLIMFEILDFVNFTVASSQYKKLGPEGGWHKIAWAFLKPVGANRHFNVEKKLRLQLYKPTFPAKTSHEHCDVYSWWSHQVWERYPATLYVTVKGVIPPENIQPALRSQVVLQQEKTSDVLEFYKPQDGENASKSSIGSHKNKMNNTEVQSCPVWSRLPAQSCKVPNEPKLNISTLAKGCFLVKFSNSGLLLACTMANEEMFSINLYTIPDGKEYAVFLGHRGLIYDLCWSSSDSMLLSGSADCTVCIWDVEKKRLNCLQMLPHPSFVYSAKFHGHRSWLLATGCNDHIVRLWVRQHKANEYNVREFCVRELRGVVINKVIVHPGGQRLLIHSRDSLLRMLDVTTGIVIQWFRGAIKHRIQTSSCISPCGGLIFSASEDGTVYVWNADTGELIALYSGLNFHSPITCVDYHPFEHMVVFSSHGSPSRVVVCTYDKMSQGSSLGLQLMNQESLHPKILDNANQTAKQNADFGSKIKKNFKMESKTDVKAENNTDEVLENEGSKSGFWNGTSDSSSYKLESPQHITEPKKKIDLSYLISQMDEILSSESHKNSSTISKIVPAQK